MVDPGTDRLAGYGQLNEHGRDVLARVWAAERAAVLELPGDNPLDERRRFRVQATRPELLAQPDVVLANWAANEAALSEAADRIAERRPERIVIAGAGDSLAVGQAARLLLSSMLGVPCEPVQSLELAYYQATDLTDRTLVIALSSSGETTRTVQALLCAQAAGSLTLAVTNRAGSTLHVEATSTLMVQATRVGWPTQSSTAPLALLLRLAALAGDRLGTADAKAALAELDDVPDLMAQTIAVADQAVAEIAAAEARRAIYLFTGAGPSLATATIGAAKVKECTPDHALAIELEEFHHYNSIKSGQPLWLFSPSGPSIGRAVDTMHEATRLGGHTHAITAAGVEAFDRDATSVLKLPPIREAFSPMLTFIPAQLVGYHLAMAKFANAQANLANSEPTGDEPTGAGHA